ncbi:MAG: hypothetical protein AAF399_08195 [Bacteroidota bacterium]
MNTSLYSSSEKKRQQRPAAAAESVNQPKRARRSMSPPALQLKASPIQREEKEEKKKDQPSKFQHNLSLLPPELQLRYWYLNLDADTKQTILKLKKDRGELGLGYEYGKDLTLKTKYGPFGANAGLNPGTKDLSFGMAYQDMLKFKGNYALESGKYGMGMSASHKGFSGNLDYKKGSGFNMGLGYGDDDWKLKGNADFGSNQYGLNFSYGAALPPMPMDLSKSVHGGVAGMHDFLGGMPRDPLAMPGYYGDQKKSVESMKKAGKDLHGLYKSGKGPRLGVAGDLAISPEDWGFMLRVGGYF